MADAPSASDVANIVVFVVPGFFARLGYLARFPQRRQEPAYALIISIAASVPLVALANSVADFLALEAEPLNAAYGLLLVTLGLVVGYLTAVLRGWSTVRSVLQVIGIPFDPEATVFERTLLGLPENAEVTVAFNDGQVVSGYPAVGPGFVEAGEARELYLTSQRWWNFASEDWTEAGDGVVVNLDQVRTISVSSDQPAEVGAADSLAEA